MKRIWKYLRSALLTAAALLFSLQGQAGNWQPDTLGKGYEMQYVEQPDDYSGAVRCTVVRHLAPKSNGTAVLYVHGYNDYFFQTEMAQRFVDRGYDFYAVDLRKYGRSIMPGQRKFELRDIKEYYPDINAAIDLMKQDGVKRVVLMGHSTGGLITSCFMAKDPNPMVKALVLNSPFLDWNQSKFQEKVLVPIVRVVGRLFKKINIKQGADSTYARSLLKSMDGEWDYNTQWKLVNSPDVQTSWISAIDRAQSIIQHNPGIKVPILLMHSDASLKPGDPKALAAQTDAVLDVEDISRYGRRLGPEVTEVVVPGGLHDLALSAPKVRNQMFTDLFTWLNNLKLN